MKAEVKQLIGIKLTPELQNELTSLRHTTGLSTSKIVREALGFYVALHKLGMLDAPLAADDVERVLGTRREALREVAETFQALSGVVETVAHAVRAQKDGRVFLVAPPRLPLASQEEAPARGDWPAEPRGEHCIPGTAGRVRLYVAEEQPILREVYESSLSLHPTIELAGSSGDTTAGSLAQELSAVKPDVVLLGLKVLRRDIKEKLRSARQGCPDAAIVLLSADYDMKGMQALRDFCAGAEGGCSYLLKHSIHTVDDLCEVIHAAAKGRITLDPAVLDGMVNSADLKALFIKQLTSRELEVLHWMAKGYRSETIADVLGLDLHEVDQAVSSICKKVSSPKSKDARVQAITLYLRATEQLPTSEAVGDSDAPEDEDP